MHVRVSEACLGTSEVSVAGNECSLGSASDGWLRTSAVQRDNCTRSERMPGSAAGQRSSQRSVSSLTSFYHVHVAMKVKFALEQPSGTGVGLVAMLVH